MLGCSEKDLRKRFDAIVDFSGVERFLDTPVKHYSSGMYVRLAYAIAAYVDADILVIDEVLAVGDAEFQKKCLEHMQRQLSQNRTCVLVSHRLEDIRKLATRVAWLDRGNLIENGAVDSALLDRYATTS
jgi:ABC-type polysaccharide/polyol phosphate transport system ATPase subunit